MNTRSWSTRSARSALIGAVIGAMIATAVTSLAAPSSGSPTQRVAFVARNDVPFDALAVGPVAGALGGIVVITSKDSLSDAALDALVQFDPDEIVIAGGSAAISDAVKEAIEDGGSWGVSRAAGSNRNETAAALADLLADLDLGRPVLSGDRADGLQAQDLRHIEADILVPSTDDPDDNGDALAAIVQDAVDALATDFMPRRIRLDDGLFRISAALDVPSGITLVGADVAGQARSVIQCDTCERIISLGGGTLESLTLRSVADRDSVTGVEFMASNATLRSVGIELSGDASLTGVRNASHRSTEIEDLTLAISAYGAGHDAIGIKIDSLDSTDVTVTGLRGSVGMDTGGGGSNGRHAYGYFLGPQASLRVSMDTTDTFRVSSGTPDPGAELSLLQAGSTSSAFLTGGNYVVTTVGGGNATLVGANVLGYASLDRVTMSQPGDTSIRVHNGSTVAVLHSDLAGSISHEGGNLDLRHSHVRFGVGGAGGTFRCFASSQSFAGSFGDICP